MTVVRGSTGVGDLLRQWRARRRLSQLQLSVLTGISTRHLSFVETARARPSRALVLRLCAALDVPQRETNHLLIAAGFSPDHRRTPSDDPATAAARAALRVVLDGHGTNPALVVDRCWNVVDANAAVAVLLTEVSPELLEPPVNSLRVALHPGGLAPRITNLPEWRATVLGRVRRQVEVTGDPAVAALYDELRTYPGAAEREATDRDSMAIPLQLQVGEQQLEFLMTVATFGTPLDATVAELVFEAFYPADELTAQALVDFATSADPAAIAAILDRTRGPLP